MTLPQNICRLPLQVAALPAGEPVAQAADDGVGAGAQQGGQQQSPLVVQDPVAPSAGFDLGNEDGDLAVRGLSLSTLATMG
jgi:hypothetical protein